MNVARAHAAFVVSHRSSALCFKQKRERHRRCYLQCDRCDTAKTASPPPICFYIPVHSNTAAVAFELSRAAERSGTSAVWISDPRGRGAYDKKEKTIQC